MAIADARLTQLRVLAEVTEPLAVNRMLLKIGIETLAKHFYKVARSERVSAAIDFARRPRRGSKWWSILRTNPREILDQNGRDECGIEIRESRDVLVSALTLPGVRATIPLEAGCAPPSEAEYPPPDFRIVQSEC